MSGERGGILKKDAFNRLMLWMETHGLSSREQWHENNSELACAKFAVHCSLCYMRTETKLTASHIRRIHHLIEQIHEVFRLEQIRPLLPPSRDIYPEGAD